MNKPTLQEAKKITDAKYNLQDSREEQIERSKIVVNHQLDETNRKIEEAFVKENKAKIKESEELK